MPRKSHELFETREQKAALEARNGLLQFAAIAKMVDESKAGFTFTPELLCELQRLAIQDIYVCAGRLRTENVFLQRIPPDPDKHQPPPWEEVSDLVQEMCEYINKQFRETSGTANGRIRDVADQLDSSIHGGERKNISGSVIPLAKCKDGIQSSRSQYDCAADRGREAALL